MTRKAVYPGSFDPVTYGHIDIIRRGLKMFDELVVAVASNPQKDTLFSIEERLRFIRDALDSEPRVQVESFQGLLVDYVRSRGASVIVRGLRAVSDFEYEFQMALMNRSLAESVETVFMMPSEQYSYLSSRLVKEVAAFGGDVSGLVPPSVLRGLKEKFENIQREGD
ncbi:MAG: pantetheine-phosphate adenylyltransferase [Nitrospinota bacterium]